MDSPETNIFIILTFILIILNAFFIFAEIAVTNSHKNQIEKLIDDGYKKAAKALKIVDDPSTYLITVQVGNVSSNILIGLFTGIAIAPFLTTQLQSIAIAPIIDYIEPISLVFSTFIIILLCLVLSTTLPRKIALNNPELCLLKIIGFLKFWQIILSPLISAFTGIANTILLIFGINPQNNDNVTEDEVKDLIERGTEEGTFEKAEQDIVDRIFHMSDQAAYDLMTPRTQMLWLDLEDDLATNLKLIKETTANVFLVGKDDLDDFVGIIYAKDVLNTLLDKQELNLEKLVRKPMFVPRAMETFRLLEKFRQSEVNEAIVLDEYGGVVGFVTIFDIINEVLGDITGKPVQNTPQIIQRDENSWYIDGLYDIDDFKERFDIEKLPNEENGHFKTMGGFITSYFGYIPKVAEVRIWDGYRFEIISMDKARVDRILMTQIK
ncbi:hemolysin family protein [Megamonas hypermegale]|uniref:hemolysin family protein n=1 Tax=Megamonas hypermegale TaxID=158847 RepID=UPI00320B1939